MAAPYDNATIIMNAARFRLNDKMPSLFPTSGKILDETQASTQQAFNNAYRRFQDALCDAGAERFQAETVIPNVPPTTNLDPAAQCSLSWNGFFDGTNNFTNPVLPSNLILPLWMSDRVAGTQFRFPDVDNPNMRVMVDGLQSFPKYQLNGQWEWRGDAIYFPGTTAAVDFRIRYRAYLPDIDNAGATRWFQQPVPVMRCVDPMAWWVCAEFAAARSADGDASEQMLAVAVACKEEAVEATKFWANRDVMKNERADVRRQPYGRGSRASGRYGYSG
jgi:hypothetical protein